jgi:uncharacterized protein YcaQ
MAVAGQLLPAPKGTSIFDVVNHVGYLQLDPTNSIARNHLLVLWSRLGNYNEAELERLRWESRELYEYAAAIVRVDHRSTRRRCGSFRRMAAPGPAPERLGADNAPAAGHRLQLRKQGPLPRERSEDIAEPAGARLLDERRDVSGCRVHAAKGEVVVAGRTGQQRIWDLGKRWLPGDSERLSVVQAERRVMERSARNLGVATATELKGYFASGPRPAATQAIESLVRDGTLARVLVEGLKGERLAHVDALTPPRRRAFTTFLSPFDPLIRNRKRTEAFWNFRYRIEIYVPKTKREYGYFVLPILHNDRLVGRIDPVFDRKTGVLNVNNVWWEQGEKEVPLDKPLRSLAAFVGADSISA